MPILRIGKPIDKIKLRQILNAAGERHGLNGSFLQAISFVETGWESNLVNQTGPDAKRGGAWGPTQITERTARAHGYKGPMEDLVRDPELAAEWTCRILKDAKPVTLADYCAAWNAGRYNADRNDDGQLEELPDGHPTKDHYLPRAQKALAFVGTHPVPTRST